MWRKRSRRPYRDEHNARSFVSSAGDRRGRRLERDPPTRKSHRARAQYCCTVRNSSDRVRWNLRDRKSTRLNSSHSQISYAVFCLKKKKKKKDTFRVDP